jgi:Resolvase, N terminal domain
VFVAPGKTGPPPPGGPKPIRHSGLGASQLHAAGCAKVYSEKVSGAHTDRVELGKLLKRLDEGDVLIVTRLDRLARSTRDLLNILDTVAKAGAGFRSLAPDLPAPEQIRLHGLDLAIAGLPRRGRHGGDGGYQDADRQYHDISQAQQTSVWPAG